MRYIFIILLSLATCCATAQSKVINLDSLKAAKTPKTEADLKKDADSMNIVAVYKGVRYTVFRSKNNKHFIVVQSPTSHNWYRKYIKQD